MSSAIANLAMDSSIMWNSVGVGSHFGPNSEFIQSIHRGLQQVATVPQTSTPVIQPTEIYPISYKKNLCKELDF